MQKRILRTKVKKHRIASSLFMVLAAFPMVAFLGALATMGFQALLTAKTSDAGIPIFLLASLTAGLAITAYPFWLSFRISDKYLLDSLQNQQAKSPKSRFRRRRRST